MFGWEWVLCAVFWMGFQPKGKEQMGKKIIGRGTPVRQGDGPPFPTSTADRTGLLDVGVKRMIQKTCINDASLSQNQAFLSTHHQNP